MQTQLLFFLIGCCTTLAQNYTHNDIVAAVDVTFQSIDTSHDSKLELYELLDVYDKLDKDGDGRVSEMEYTQRATVYHKFFGIVFLQLDYDGDGYLDRSSEYGQYTMMDTNGDNEVSRREYDVYYTKVIDDAMKNYGYLLGDISASSARSRTT